MLNSTWETWVLWFQVIKNIPKLLRITHLYLNLIGVTLETVEYDMILCHVTSHVTMSVMSNIDGSLTVSLAEYNMTWKHIQIAQAGGELKTKSNKLIVKRGKSHSPEAECTGPFRPGVSRDRGACAWSACLEAGCWPRPSSASPASPAPGLASHCASQTSCSRITGACFSVLTHSDWCWPDH